MQTESTWERDWTLLQQVGLKEIFGFKEMELEQIEDTQKQPHYDRLERIEKTTLQLQQGLIGEI